MADKKSGFDFGALAGNQGSTGRAYDGVLGVGPQEVVGKYKSLPGLTTAVFHRSGRTLSARKVGDEVRIVRLKVESGSE